MQQMFMANMPTQLGMGGSLPEAKRGEGILDMLSADKNSTVFFSKDESLKASLLTLPIALAFATSPKFDDSIRALSLMFALRTIPELLYGLEGRDLPSFGSGGSLQTMRSGPAIGPDHQSGMLGVTKQGAPFLFEGGEYIVSRAAASRIGSSNLDQLNKGKIPGSMASGGVIPEKDLGAGLLGLTMMAPFMMEEIDSGVASMGRGVNYFFENIGDLFMAIHPLSLIHI